MNRIILVMCLGLCVHTLSGQHPAQKSNSSALEAISFMLGKWEGTSWAMTPQGRSTAKVTEQASCKWDCELILVEGKGTRYDSASQTEIIVHNAFGVIRYDAQQQKIFMQAYAQGRGMVESEMELLEDNMFRWGMKLPNGAEMRYTADFREDNSWKEIGEYSHDGQTWREVLGTDLKRVSGE